MDNFYINLLSDHFYFMIQLKEILTPSQVLVNVHVTSKKKALELIAQTAAENHNELDEHDLFEHLIERERLGTTGFGNGVAIPHCRIENCQLPIAVVLKLINPIDFDAVDNELVDILVGLVVPNNATEEHLQLLKQIAALLSDAQACKQIRASTSTQELYQILTNGVSGI